MYDKKQENKKEAIDNKALNKTIRSGATFPIVDNRLEAIAQRKLQKMIFIRNELTQFKPKKKRGKITKHDREARREAKFSSTRGGTTIFNNNERKLPRAPRGTHYVETDSGSGRTNRGKRRVVSLVEDGGRVLKQYLTYDHYKTFREV